MIQHWKTIQSIAKRKRIILSKFREQCNMQELLDILKDSVFDNQNDSTLAYAVEYVTLYSLAYFVYEDHENAQAWIDKYINPL